MWKTAIGRVRLAGLMEGASFLLLLAGAMPMKYFADQSKSPEFRLNVAVNDRDTPGDSIEGMSQIWWRPDWRSDETYDGSGTFRRQ